MIAVSASRLEAPLKKKGKENKNIQSVGNMTWTRGMRVPTKLLAFYV
jgi:hypothetical protein